MSRGHKDELAVEAVRRAKKKWGSAWHYLAAREREEKVAVEFLHMVASWTSSVYSQELRDAAMSAQDIFALVGADA